MHFWFQHYVLSTLAVYLFFAVLYGRKFNQIKKAPNVCTLIVGGLLWFPIVLVWVYGGLWRDIKSWRKS